jgi:hypothetical protein
MRRYILPAITAILTVTTAWLIFDRIQLQDKLTQVDAFAADIAKLKVSTEFQRTYSKAHMLRRTSC